MTPKLASVAFARWNFGVASLRAVGRTENYVYRIRQRDGTEHYLRISPPNYRPKSEIEAELDFVRHLDARKIPVAAPVRSRRRKWLEVIDTPAGEMYAAVFRAIHGREMRWGDEAQNRKMLLARGRSLGRMHSAARFYKPSGKVARFHWFEDDLFTDPERYLAKRDRIARREYESLINWMLDRDANRENYGIVHGDFGSGNTRLLPDGMLAAFDFDDCLHHWYIYDLAVTIRSAIDMPAATRKRYLRILLEGYAEEKDLGQDGAAEVAQFCRLAALYRYIAAIRECERGGARSEQRRRVLARREVLRRSVRWT